jgi:hypothetical protein
MKNEFQLGERVTFNTNCNTKAGNRIHKGNEGTIKSITSKNGIPAIELKEFPGSIFSPNSFI